MATAHEKDSQRHGGAHLDRPDRLDREQYSISDLTEEFDCTARALRFYEDEGLIAPARIGLARVYSKRDRARLAWIMRAKNVGFSLTEIREMIDLYDLGDGRVETALQLDHVGTLGSGHRAGRGAMRGRGPRRIEHHGLTVTQQERCLVDERGVGAVGHRRLVDALVGAGHRAGERGAERQKNSEYEPSCRDVHRQAPPLTLHLTTALKR